MIPLIVILIYLCIIGYIGSVAFRRSKENTEDFFLAGRSLGTMVFFLSLFATNMTAFAILGSSGIAYKRGIGIYGLMASSSGFIIPLCIFFIGTRLWALGKRFGFQTQVQLFRDRWECSGVGTAIFALFVVMLLPYMIIAIMGGGTVLEDISRSGGPTSPALIPYWLGCLIVATVVTINVFFGGMRGVVWVNIFQTILFLLFGAVAVVVISNNLPGGLGAVLAKMAGTPAGALLARDRIPAEEFWSYTLIPFSSIMFPHMAIMCFSAKKMSAFKNTVIAYPVAIMAVWLPSVFLGVVGAAVIPGLDKSDGVLLQLLAQYSSPLLAGILGAGIISAVMGSDCHQVLALSTMFTKDVFQHYGGEKKYGEKGSVVFARMFILVVTVAAFVISLMTNANIFEIAIRFAFSGFASLAPVMIAALYWKRSTKYGALASVIWVAFCLLSTGWLQSYSDPMAPQPPKPPVRVAAGAGAPGGGGPPGVAAGKPGDAPTGAGLAGAPKPVGAPAGPAGGPPAGAKPGGKPAGPKMVQVFPNLGDMFLRNQTTVTIYGYLPVVPMMIGSALLMIIFSLASKPPSQATIDRYFGPITAGSAE